MAETVAGSIFYHWKPNVANLHNRCSLKKECVLALLISILWIAFFTRHIVVLDYIAPFVIAIHLVLLAHLVYCVAILVMEFSRVFVEDVDAFCVCYILDLALIGNIYRSCIFGGFLAV